MGSLMFAPKLFTNWQRAGTRLAPFKHTVPVSGCPIVNTINGAPLFKWFCLAFDGNKSIAPIIYLLLLRGPFAITRLIITIVINSIYRVIFWPVSHIRSKNNKIIPSFANLYSSAAIIIKIFIIFIVTPLSDRKPSRIKNVPTIRTPMLFKSSNPIAPTRFYTAAIKVARINDLFISATTFTKPFFTITIMDNFFYYCKKAKNFTSKIFVFSHINPFCGCVNSQTNISQGE